MTFALGTASGVERAIACPASLILPQVRTVTEFANAGTARHAFVRGVLAGVPRENILASLPEEHRTKAAQIPVDRLVGDLRDVRAEVAYAYSLTERTGRELGVNIDRAYSKHGALPDDLPGSADIEGVRDDGVPVVADLKFGFLPVTHAEENAQLLTLCLAKARALGVERIEGRIVKPRDDGTVFVDSHEYDSLALDAFADELDDALKARHEVERVYLARGVPDVNPGDGTVCRYCDAMPSCPAYTQLARAMGGHLDALELRIAAMTAIECGESWLQLKKIKALAEVIEKTIKGRAATEPLPLGNGKILGPLRYQARSFAPEAALALLQAKGATETEIASCWTTSTRESVRELRDPAEAPALTRKRRPRKEAA